MSSHIQGFLLVFAMSSFLGWVFWEEFSEKDLGGFAGTGFMGYARTAFLGQFTCRDWLRRVCFGGLGVTGLL